MQRTTLVPLVAAAFILAGCSGGIGSEQMRGIEALCMEEAIEDTGVGYDGYLNDSVEAAERYEECKQVRIDRHNERP